MPNLDLILKDIEDKYVRENFFRVQNYVSNQPLLVAGFQFYEVDISAANTKYTLPHGLGFIPTDIIILSASGDQNFYFRYQEFDRTNIYLTNAGPVKIRFLGGLFNQPGYQKTLVDRTLVPPTIATCPSGMLSPFAGSAAPSGWLICDGSAVSRTTYAALFTAISTTYGVGDGSTTFNVPDMRGRVAAGKDNMGGAAANRITAAGSGITGTTLGAVGGAETHVLTTAQMPSHTHDSRINGAPVYQAATGGAGANNQNNTNGNNTGGQLWTTTSAGSDTAHNNAQPTMILNYIIKT